MHVCIMIIASQKFFRVLEH